MGLVRKTGVVFICFGTLLLAVTTFALTRRQKPMTTADNNLNDVVINFERSGCYGDCPAYKLTVFGDGRVDYSGVNFVKQTGKAQGHIEPASVQRLVAEFDKANFW